VKGKKKKGKKQEVWWKPTLFICKYVLILSYNLISELKVTKEDPNFYCKSFYEPSTRVVVDVV
jgi:hypothetical protein